MSACSQGGNTPCFAGQCSTPHNGLDAHSWRSLRRSGCWCPHQAPQRVHCIGPAWPVPSHMLSVWRSGRSHLFINFRRPDRHGRRVRLFTGARPFLQPCNWVHSASWCSSGSPAESPRWGWGGTGACCCLWRDSAGPWSPCRPCLWGEFWRAIPSYPLQLKPHEGSLSHWSVTCVLRWERCTITRNAFPLDGFSNDGCGLMARLTQGFAELLHTVSIHDNGMPATHVTTRVWPIYSLHKQTILHFISVFLFYLPKSFTAFLIFLHVMLQRGGVTLPQTVDVHDGHQVVKLVIGGKRHGLPHCTLRHFTIPQQAVDTVAEEGKRARWGWGARHLNVLRQFSIQTRFTQFDSWAGSQVWHGKRSQRLFQGVGPECQTLLWKESWYLFFKFCDV